ncbi:hypothetical protein JTB14_005406 [Gonioctena quinquepunctata]|nr:hypothetical protein JTB14_005406 [Gonioctena quinquepunctata]
MVRTYKRKRPAQPDIPRRVLKNAVKNVISKKEEFASSKYATRQVFSRNEEIELEIYLKKSSKICYGLTYELCRRLAFQYASKLNEKIPRNWGINKKAGKAEIDWMQCFMKRHPRLSNRRPENTSIARASAFNRANVEEFFNNYASVQATCNFSPDRIWNTDETGITTVLQAPRVIAETGSKAVGQCVSAKRGSLVTMCGIISAVGASIPPLYIFPRVRMKDQFLYGAVPGAVGYAEKSGWMSTRVFLKLLEHIKKHTNSSPTNKILLLMDNHETHVSLDAILFAREHGIVLLSFPPHCTHKMQPLDKGVYGPFKSKCKISFNDFILSNPDVKPLPKACPRNTTRKSRKRKSRIYTSTPEKQRIEELEKAKLMNVKKTNSSRKLVSESKPKKMQNSKQSKRRKKNKAVSDDISSSDSDINLPFIVTKKIKNDLSDSDMDLDYSADDDELNKLLDDEKILRDDYLLVKFATKKDPYIMLEK